VNSRFVQLLPVETRRITSSELRLRSITLQTYVAHAFVHHVLISASMAGSRIQVVQLLDTTHTAFITRARVAGPLALSSIVRWTVDVTRARAI
jgi:hypothetical protein